MSELIGQNLLGDVKGLIEQSRARVARSVNSELVLLYWAIGTRIRQDVLGNERADYGKQLLPELARVLQLEYGKGFAQRNLQSMVRFAEVLPDFEILQTLSAQLSWSHLVEIIYRDSPLERDFYLEMARLEGWSVRTLRERIGTQLYARTLAAGKGPQVLKAALEGSRNSGATDLDLVLHDPYVLDFLKLPNPYNEKDLEAAIMADLERFLLELGAGFTFVARQKRITVDTDHFYMDLLLYNRQLRRLAVIDLKLEAFKPAFKGQMELYLRYLDRFEKLEGEEAPIGLILCSEKKQGIVELMGLEQGDIRVSQYLTQFAPLELLEKTLQASVERHKELAARRKVLEEGKRNE